MTVRGIQSVSIYGARLSGAGFREHAVYMDHLRSVDFEQSEFVPKLEKNGLLSAVSLS
jgi:hypothetical protein